MIYYCSIQTQSTALATPRAMVCCLKLLSATFGNAGVFHAPIGWWKASTMFFGADAFKQPIGAWNMSAVTNMGGCSVELMPQTNRLVPGTHQEWRTWSWCCILQLSWTRPAVHWMSRCVPNLDGLVQGKHHVLWFWCLQPVHWGLEHVSSDQHGGMFRGANASNQPIGAWNTSGVTDMESMLYSAVVLNQTSCSLPMCPKSWWIGLRQAPCSLVLMPLTSPLGPGTCQQWPTWGDIPWS